jgi:hypothetical protein
MKKSAVILLAILVAVVVVAGCGSSGNGSSVEGVYKAEAGGKTAAVLTLKANNNGTLSLSEDLAGVPVTYKVKDKTVVLVGDDGKTAVGTFKIVNGGLEDFAGNLYKKQ